VYYITSTLQMYRSFALSNYSLKKYFEFVF